MDIEKLVEECARGLDPTMFDPPKSMPDVFEQQREIARYQARAVIRRTLEFAAGEAKSVAWNLKGVAVESNSRPARVKCDHSASVMYDFEQRLRDLARSLSPKEQAP